jgi:outer membrane protein assembly factor BamB
MRLMTAFAMISVLGLAAQSLGDWPQFLGPNRDGTAPAEAELKLPWPKAGPPIAWQRTVGAGFSGPVVAGERLILFHRVGEEEVVECLHAVSGKLNWKFAYPTHYRDEFGFDEGPRATPCIAGSQVFTLGAEGVLHALDLATGKQLWHRDLNGDYGVKKGFFGVGTSPLVVGQRVIVNVGGREAKAGVVALDRLTGKEAWRATDHEASYASPIVARLNDKQSIVVFTREGPVGLDAESGQVQFSRRWRARINASVNAATPLALDGHLFVTTSYGVGALLLRPTREGLAEVWSNDESLSSHYNTPVRLGEQLYGIDGRQEAGAELRCIDWKTGKVRWTRPRFGCATLILVGKHVLCLTESGELVAIEANPTEYTELARAVILEKPVRAHPALAYGRLFARDERKLICAELIPKPGR